MSLVNPVRDTGRRTTMKLYCVYTPSHEGLLRDWFLPSLPGGLELVALPLQIEGRGDFLGVDFLQCIRDKIANLILSIRDNDGSWILWSDVDILFFERAPQALNDVVAHAGATRVFFQRERATGREVNTGFMLMRCCDETRRFFEDLGARLLREPDKNEQAIANEMLREGVAINWELLPDDFVARSHGWPPPARMSIYHANCTMGPNGVMQKIRQFRQVREIRGLLLPSGPVSVLSRFVDLGHRVRRRLGLG